MDPLTNRHIQTGLKMSIEPYLSWCLGCIDTNDKQFGNGSVWTQAQTRSDSLEPVLTLVSYQKLDSILSSYRSNWV